mgnify:CR=1 FL=1
MRLFLVAVFLLRYHAEEQHAREGQSEGRAVWKISIQRPHPVRELSENRRHAVVGPDVEILDKLLQPGDILLTGDCVLHMQALECRRRYAG